MGVTLQVSLAVKMSADTEDAIAACDLGLQSLSGHLRPALQACSQDSKNCLLQSNWRMAAFAVRHILLGS